MTPIHLAFLGCGFITKVHSRHLRTLGSMVRISYASRDGARAESYRRRFGGLRAWGSYDEALEAGDVDAVVVAVPPAFHRRLTLKALEAGKHVLVEKPAFPGLADYQAVAAARDSADRVVMVGENDHYKPLAVTLRRLLEERLIGELVFVRLTTIARRPKPLNDWRQDPALAGGDAFFEEGIHWLHLADSLGPRIREIHACPPRTASAGNGTGEGRRSSMLVAFRYDTGASGALFYSREIPVLMRGLGLSTLYGRDGVVTFESNGLAVLVRGRRGPRLFVPGFRDLRGYRAMYRDFLRAVRGAGAPEMTVERAAEDHRLMERIASAPVGSPVARA